MTQETIPKLVNAAQSMVKQSLKKYVSSGKLPGKESPRQMLIASFREQYNSEIGTMFDNTLAQSKAKFLQFKMKADASSIPQDALTSNLTRTYVSVNFKNENGEIRSIKKVELDKIWDEMTKAKGTFSTVTYRNGTNYPLDTYVAGKIRTISQETTNATVAADMTNRGVYTAKVSVHGATDTCKKYEGEIIFSSRAAKSQFVERFPDKKEYHNLLTFEDLKADTSSHIFKFNCRHRMTPYPVQYMRGAK